MNTYFAQIKSPISYEGPKSRSPLNASELTDNDDDRQSKDSRDQIAP